MGSDTMSKRLSKKQFQYVEEEVRNYHETKKQLEELRLNVITGAIHQEYRDENIGGSSSGNISNQVEQRVTLLYMDNQIQRMNKVVRAIEKVLSKLSAEDKNLVQLRYWSKHKNTWEYIAKNSYMDRATAIRHRNFLIQEIAKNMGF